MRLRGETVKHKERRRYSAYTGLLLSYFVIIGIFSFTSLMLMRQSHKALTDEIMRANSSSMRQMRTLVENGLRDIEQICYEQSVNADTQDFLYAKNHSNEANKNFWRISMLDVVRNLNSAAKGSSYVDMLYLLTLNDPVVVASNGKYSFPEFYQRYLRETALDEALCFQKHQDTEYKRYLTLPLEGGGGYELFFLYAFPLDTRNKLAVVGSRVNVSALRAVMKANAWFPASELALLDEYGQVLLSETQNTDADVAALVPWRELTSGAVHTVRINKESYTVLVDDILSVFRCGVVVHSDVFSQAQNEHARIYAVGLFFILLTGVAVAVVMSVLQYRPIRRLVDVFWPGLVASNPVVTRIKSRLPVRSETSRKETQPAEFRLIENGIAEMRSANAALHEDNRKQSGLLRKQRVFGMLYGVPADKRALEQALREAGMTLSHSQFLFVSETGRQAEQNEEGADCPDGLSAEWFHAFCGDMDVLEFDIPSGKVFLLNFPGTATGSDWQEALEKRPVPDAFRFITVGRRFADIKDISAEFLYLKELTACQGARGSHVLFAEHLPETWEGASAGPGKPVKETVRKEALVAEAAALIHDCYTDMSLSVNYISGELNISPVALTRAFKSVMGMGVLEYIQKTRLDAAKRLMGSTPDNLLEIAQKVGYSNSVTFVRVFKKYEGITPSRYRSAILSDSCTVNKQRDTKEEQSCL